MTFFILTGMRLYSILCKATTVPGVAARIPGRGQYDAAACDGRRRWVEEQTGADLTELGGWWESKGVDPSILKGNIENAIGLVRIPVAVAGPLLFHGDQAQGE